MNNTLEYCPPSSLLPPRANTISVYGILYQAREMLIKPGGWIQGASKDDKGGFCISGAVITVVDRLTARPASVYHHQYIEFWARAAMSALCPNLPYPLPKWLAKLGAIMPHPLPSDAIHPGNYVIHWNDRPARKHSEVVTLFDLTLLQISMQPNMLQDLPSLPVPTSIYNWNGFHGYSVAAQEQLDLMTKGANQLSEGEALANLAEFSDPTPEEKEKEEILELVGV